MLFDKIKIPILIFSVTVLFAAKVEAFRLGANIKEKLIYVSPSGSDQSSGTAEHPFRTISKAALTATSGDRIIIAEGIYRESVIIGSGGLNDGSRVIFQAASGGKVEIKGSERRVNWKKQRNKLWSITLDSGVFKDAVFFNNRKLQQKNAATATSATPQSWYQEKKNGKVTIWGNFGSSDPNVNLTETVSRKSGISCALGIDFITLKGITVSQIANEPAIIYGEQPGAIETKNGKYWQILNCTVRDCRSVGISIGIKGHPYLDASPRKPEFSDFADLAAIGHHTIRNNHIFNCGQAGIFGFSAGSSSTISDNLIEDINVDGEYDGPESAGIRLALCIDATLTHNLIRRVYGKGGNGIYLGPIFQGTRVSANMISDIQHACLYLFKNHGPTLFDNNILIGSSKRGGSGKGIDMLASEANVFVQNLFSNCSFANEFQPGKSVSTSNFLPHSLMIKQTIPALNIDHRWYGNLFIGKGLGLAKYAGAEVDFNAYLAGAVPLEWADSNSVRSNSMNVPRFEHSVKGLTILWETMEMAKLKMPLYDADYFGFFALSKQYIESPEGKKLTINKDFFGSPDLRVSRIPGPFYHIEKLKKIKSLF